VGDQNTSTTTGDNLLSTLYQRKAIATLHDKCMFYRVAEKFALPQREGKTMVFNGWRKIGAASSTLAEASSNAAVNLSSRKVTATIASYGRHCKITDLSEFVSVIGPMDGAMKELTQSATLTQDNVVQLAVFKNVLAQVGAGADVKTKLLSAWTGSLASSFCADTGTSGKSRQFGFPVVFGTSATRLSAQTTKSISSTPGPILVR
jgi:N4-gp56 family major capsid protein